MPENAPSYPNGTHVSSNLTWAELACHDAKRTPYPHHWRRSRAVVLARAFEMVRAACGDVPLSILSGYRTPAHNKAIGGAVHSQHVEGRAIDLRTPKGLTVSQFAECVREAIRAGAPIRGLGIYRRWGCHIDLRPGDRLVTWSDAGPSPEGGD
jgi:hypothetical protein